MFHELGGILLCLSVMCSSCQQYHIEMFYCMWLLAALVNDSPSVLQILHLVEFINDFLSNNPFVVCSEELNHVKHELAREGDSVKVKHKTGIILYRATQDRSVRLSVYQLSSNS